VKPGRLARNRPGPVSTASSSARPRRTTRLRRLRYRFDSALSRGPWTVVLWLAAVTGGLVVVGAAVVAGFRLGIAGGKPVGFLEAFWQTLLRVLDTGTFASDAGWELRIVSLLVTLSGIFVATSLIGLVATSLDQRIADLRKGRSPVAEAGHTLVLGWSPRVLTVLSELVEANRNRRRAAVVVLAAEDKTVMEDRIRAHLHDAGTTRVVCRTGDPARAADLALVNARDARAIVVLADDSEAGDAAAVKAALAVITGDAGTGPAHVVVELHDGRTARSLRAAVDPRVSVVEPNEVIAKVTAQACYQPGLSLVFADLLDFEGDEIYFAPASPVAGRTFGDALLAYRTSTVLGRLGPDGALHLNPPMDSVFGAGDSVVAVSEDDDTVVFSGFSEADPPPAATGRGGARPASERLLVVGWSGLGPSILRELGGHLGGAALVDVVVDEVLVPGAAASVDPGCDLDVRFHSTDDEAQRLTELAASTTYDHVLVLGYRRGVAPAEADARTLLVLLTLRRVLGGGRPPRIVAEVLDSRDVDIARATGADDFVVSDRLSSLMMAQLAERPGLGTVFDQLFAPGGASVGLWPAAPYGADGSPRPFAALVAAARACGQVAMGYRRQDGSLVLNPPKDAVVDLAPGDQLVLLAGH
jgi:voltage-gated potassium channel Kch